MATVQPSTAKTPSTRTTISGSDEMVHRILDASTDRVTAALPHAVAQAMQTAVPHLYTAERAAEFAEAMITELRKPQTLTPEQSTLVMDEGLGGWRTTRVETDLRDIDDQRTPAENGETPFLAAEVVVSDYRSRAYGRKTEVWVSYGLTTGSVTPAKAREVLAAMRGFASQLEAVVDLADEIAEDDFEGDPEIAAADRAAEDLRIKRITEARG
ncbi:hypothetical protein OG985_21585 [Streptomyces sp. NBC_00289]|uniref:hypothetical protein n=1 Tax=Streptomyces sp. NBC_00289 TaxID=2975703 RepID=UPI00324C4B9C